MKKSFLFGLIVFGPFLGIAAFFLSLTMSFGSYSEMAARSFIMIFFCALCLYARTMVVRLTKTWQKKLLILGIMTILMLVPCYIIASTLLTNPMKNYVHPVSPLELYIDVMGTTLYGLIFGLVLELPWFFAGTWLISKIDPGILSER